MIILGKASSSFSTQKISSARSCMRGKKKRASLHLTSCPYSPPVLIAMTSLTNILQSFFPQWWVYTNKCHLTHILSFVNGFGNAWSWLTSSALHKSSAVLRIPFQEDSGGDSLSHVPQSVGRRWGLASAIPHLCMAPPFSVLACTNEEALTCLWTKGEKGL